MDLIPARSTRIRAATYLVVGLSAGALGLRPARAQVTVLDQQAFSGLVAIDGPAPSRVSDSQCGSANAPTARVIADDFGVAAAVDVTSISWLGSYRRLSAPADPTAFTLIFHGDAGGAPGATIATLSVLPTQTLLSSGLDLSGQPLSGYSFLVSIAPIHFEPGTYWVEIFETDSTIPECFEWSPGLQDVARGRDGDAFSPTAPGSAWTVNLRADPLDNRALVLQGSLPALEIPTLGEWGMGLLVAILAIVGALTLRRRSRSEQPRIPPCLYL